MHHTQDLRDVACGTLRGGAQESNVDSSTAATFVEETTEEIIAQDRMSVDQDRLSHPRQQSRLQRGTALVICHDNYIEIISIIIWVIILYHYIE